MRNRPLTLRCTLTYLTTVPVLPGCTGLNLDWRYLISKVYILPPASGPALSNSLTHTHCTHAPPTAPVQYLAARVLQYTSCRPVCPHPILFFCLALQSSQRTKTTPTLNPTHPFPLSRYLPHFGPFLLHYLYHYLTFSSSSEHSQPNFHLQ